MEFLLSDPIVAKILGTSVGRDVCEHRFSAADRGTMGTIS